NLKLDDSTLTGTLAVPDLSKQAVRFDLALDTIDLDHYLPVGSCPAQHAAATHSKKFMETRLPGRLLSKLNMAGQLKIGQLSGFGLKASALTLKLNAANGVVTLDPLAASLYGGSYAGSVKLARAGQGVALTTHQKLNQVDAGKIITALGGGSRLSGTANVLIDLQGQGDTVAEMLDTLKGNATFDILHGSLDGVNLWDSLERAYALVKEHKQLPATGPKRTEFANFKGSADIAHGIVNNDALEADLPFIALTGHGTVNLAKQYLDYDLLAKVVKTPKTGSADLSKLKGLTVPMHISGNYADISSVPDIKQALEAKAKAAVQKKLDKEKQSAKDKLKKKLQDLLGGGGGGGG
ncbi:MAG: AsmA family protein, partial [Gammaproteobacteria bacterium]